MSDAPSTALSGRHLTNFQAVTTKSEEEERLVGLRFSYLIKQHLDRGWNLEELAAKIGCHASLLSKWRDPVKVRSGLADRASLRAKIIGGVRRGLRISSEYFYVQAKDLPNVVALPDGSERACDPDEVDCYAAVLSLDKKRGEIDAAARKQIAANEAEIADLRTTVSVLSADMRRMVALMERMVGTDAANRR